MLPMSPVRVLPMSPVWVLPMSPVWVLPMSPVYTDARLLGCLTRVEHGDRTGSFAMLSGESCIRKGRLWN